MKLPAAYKAHGDGANRGTSRAARGVRGRAADESAKSRRPISAAHRNGASATLRNMATSPKLVSMDRHPELKAVRGIGGKSDRDGVIPEVFKRMPIETLEKYARHGVVGARVRTPPASS